MVLESSPTFLQGWYQRTSVSLRGSCLPCGYPCLLASMAKAVYPSFCLPSERGLVLDSSPRFLQGRYLRNFVSFGGRSMPGSYPSLLTGMHACRIFLDNSMTFAYLLGAVCFRIAAPDFSRAGTRNIFSLRGSCMPCSYPCLLSGMGLSSVSHAVQYSWQHS